MSAAVLWLALAFVPDDRAILAESVDVVEVNHYLNDEGEPVLDQLLFYRWRVNHHQLIDWRLIKSPECLPVRHGGHWECFWRDGHDWRRIRAASYRETWTQWDVETADRETNPVEYRPRLRAK